MRYPVSDCALVLALGVSIVNSFPGSAQAEVVCPDSSYVTVDYSCTFDGAYRTGEPFDVLTTMPLGGGETLADIGVVVHAYLRDANGAPVAGEPASSLTLEFGMSPVYSQCVCEGMQADGPTDANGHTTFSGKIRGGGHAPNLVARVNGVPFDDVAVIVNSIEYNGNCEVQHHDWTPPLVAFYSGDPYDIQLDLNEDGYIDLRDAALVIQDCCGPRCGAPFPFQGGVETGAAK